MKKIINSEKKMIKGRHCDRCGHYLSEDEFDKYGSWNYTCQACGFRYIHGMNLEELSEHWRCDY